MFFRTNEPQRGAIEVCFPELTEEDVRVFNRREPDLSGKYVDPLKEVSPYDKSFEYTPQWGGVGVELFQRAGLWYARGTSMGVIDQFRQWIASRSHP